jgi:sterol 3beta-glucosyltransferase
MVKNKGFLPSGPSEIPIQRKQMKEIIFSLLPACKEPDPDTGIPFKVDAIIANPPAYGQYILFILKKRFFAACIVLFPL